MKTPTPVDLNEAIRRWQENLGKSPAFKADNLEELASHLRASVQKLKASGLSEEEAFKIAARRIGERGPLEREFAKVNPLAKWSLPVILFWMTAGVYLVQIVYSPIRMILDWPENLRSREIMRYNLLVAQRFQTMGAHRDHIVPDFGPYHHWTIFPVLGLSVAVVVVFMLGARLVMGSWKRFGGIIKIFERPFRTAMGLAMLGFVVTMGMAMSGYGIFDLSIMLEMFFPKHANPFASLAAVNVALVLAMVLLARRGLGKTSPPRRQNYGNPNPI